jgi:hypothetical protein
MLITKKDIDFQEFKILVHYLVSRFFMREKCINFVKRLRNR